MRIRSYTAADCPAVLALFYHTVHTVNRQHYAPDQLDAWAPADPDAARWDSSLGMGTASYLFFASSIEFINPPPECLSEAV